jgi:hypothetical protein
MSNHHNQLNLWIFIHICNFQIDVVVVDSGTNLHTTIKVILALKSWAW